MAKITRKLQKQFGATATSTQVGQYGSFANSTPNYTKDPDVIQALTQYSDGWYSAVIGFNSPAMQDVNSLDYLYAYQLGYITQAGVCEWLSTQTYYIGSLASDGTGKIFYSRTDNNTGNTLANGTNWLEYGGAITTNLNAATLTVVSGSTYFQPNYIIDTGATWTVNSGGYLMAFGPTIVNGTLITNGTSRTV